jgi:CBS domain-containing protein
MPLSQFVKKDIVTAKPEQKIRDVAELMRSENVGAILVADESGKPLGMITDRDIVLRCVCDGADCSTTMAEEVMTEDLETVPVSAGIKDVLECMKASQIRRVPIVDESGKAVALLSFGDLFSMLATEIGALAEVTKPEYVKIDRLAA